MKHIFLNLKRFDISPEKGGVNRLAPMKDWGRTIVSGTQDALTAYNPAEVEFVMYMPEAHLLGAAAAKTENSPVQLGCQGVYRADTAVGGNFGAFTTNRPANAAAQMGCASTLIGHCEERNDKMGILAEAGVTGQAAAQAVNRILNQEIKCAQAAGLTVLYCIGEKSEEQADWENVLGTISLLHYTQDSFLSDQEEMALERKFDIARTGASVFVHSIKNQLLANRILEKRISQELDKPEPDLSRVRACVKQLQESNEMLISRSEELYRTVKNKSVTLVPTTLGQIRETTLERFKRKYPDALLECRLNESETVLADGNYLSEALYNLLTNAWEANVDAGHGDRPIRLSSSRERLYVVLEVRDEGCGMTKAEQKKIFEPFYSSKNSNTSWGMGLYHVRTIVRAHVGSLRVESKPGRGTSFFVLLPKYVQDR